MGIRRVVRTRRELACEHSQLFNEGTCQETCASQHHGPAVLDLGKVFRFVGARKDATNSCPDQGLRDQSVVPTGAITPPD